MHYEYDSGGGNAQRGKPKPNRQRHDRVRFAELYAVHKSYSEVARICGCDASTVRHALNPDRLRGYNERWNSRNGLKRTVHCRVSSANRRAARGPRPVHHKPLCDTDLGRRTIAGKIRHSIGGRVRLTNKHNEQAGVLSKQEVMDKILSNPVCFYSGKPIDLYRQAWQLDHFQPIAQGGKNHIDNLVICLQAYNMSKGDLLYEEWLEVCRNVLTHAGYTVIEPGNS